MEFGLVWVRSVHGDIQCHRAARRIVAARDVEPSIATSLTQFVGLDDALVAETVTVQGYEDTTNASQARAKVLILSNCRAELP